MNKKELNETEVCMKFITPAIEQAGWDKQRLRKELMQRLVFRASDLLRGAGDCAEGLPPQMFTEAEKTDVSKFRPDGLWFVHAGGKAGLFSAIIGGWINGAGGSQPVTTEIRP